MTGASPIREEELHAYLDGELSPERHSSVAAYLRDKPDQAARLEAYRRDDAAIARLFSEVGGGLAAAPAFVAPPRRSLLAQPWLRAAAAVVLFAAGTLAGWLARDAGEAEAWQGFAAQATTTHLLFASGGGESLPVDSVDSVNQAMSAALGAPVALRDLAPSGYSLTAARILPGAARLSVQLSFRSPAGESFSLQMQGRPGAEESPFRHILGESVTTVVWEDDDHGLICAVTGAMSAARLEQIARAVYHDLLI